MDMLQQEKEEAVFLSQVDLEEWHKEEDKFTNLLTTYIQKQFREVGRRWCVCSAVAGLSCTTEITQVLVITYILIGIISDSCFLQFLEMTSYGQCIP